MATINGSTNSAWWTFKLEVKENSTNTAKNTSSVTVTAYIGRGSSAGSSYMWGANISCSVGITGCGNQTISYKNSNQVNVAAGAWLNIGSTTFSSVPHNVDGSKTVTVSASFTNSISPGSGSASGNVTLTTIPRASQPSCITYPNNTQNIGYFDTNFTVHMNRASANFTHTVRYAFGSRSGNIASNVQNNTVWKVPWEFINDIPNSKSGTGTIYVDTYNGTSLIGTKSCSFTATVSENESTKPTVNAVLSPTPVLADWVTTEYVQGKSSVNAVFTAAAKLSASIKSYSLTVDGKTTTQSGTPVTSQILSKSGTQTVTLKATDTREISSEELTENIEVIPYGIPIIAPHTNYGSIICARCDDEGTLDDSGTNLKLVIKGKWYSLANKENTAAVEVKYTSTDFESDWIPIAAEEQGGGADNGYISYYDINTVAEGVTLAVDKTYKVTVRCIDRFGAYTDISYKIPTEDINFHLRRGGRGAAFGKYSEEEDTLEIAENWDLKLKNNKLVNFEIEQGVDGIWTYRKYSDGSYRAEYLHTPDDGDTITLNTAYGSIYLNGTASIYFNPPSFNKKITHYSGEGSVVTNYSGIFLWMSAEAIGWRMWSAASVTDDNYRLSIKIEGTWK